MDKPDAAARRLGLIEEALQHAALAVSSAHGDRIFQELARFLATILHCEFALIGQVKNGVVRTLGVYGEDGYHENFEYPLRITPCREVVGRGFHLVANGVAERYPEDVQLQRFGAQGYAGYPLNDAAGSPVGVLAILSRRPLVNHSVVESVLKIFAVRAEAEIEHKNAVEKLRASESQYRAIFNASADSLVLRDADFRVVDVNPAYEAMSGRPRAEALGRSELTMSPPELTAHVRALHARALAGEPVMFEALARRKNGERFDIETRGVPILHQGRPHVLYIGRDITARKSAEEVLRASEEQYRAIFNAAADALVLRDAAFRIVDVNPAYEALSGYSREEVLGRGHVVANPAQDEARIRALHARALAGEQVMLETTRLSKDGGSRDVELRGVPIVHRGAPHVLYIGRDITARRRAEAERAALEAQLREAQKMEALGHLTGGIAHDFNNLLASIMGYVVLAAERDAAAADAKLGGYLDQALASSRKARDLIQQMLTFSRGKRGKPRATDLADAVEESLKLVRGSLPSSVEIRPQLKRDAAAVMLDPVQLDQVLLNLSINARDAMEGAGKLRVRVWPAYLAAGVCASCRQPFSGSFVELAVSDTGPGIPPRVLERMFEPFFTTKEVGRGSGMGLATVHGIVHDHGGHILVQNPQRGGSRFRVLLPALSEGIAPSPQESKAGSARGRPPLRGRVLIVDDEAPVAGFMSELLQSWGLEAAALTDPSAALAAFSAAPRSWDVVITDQTMPGTTGFNLARALLSCRPDLPVVLCTGHLDPIAQRDLDAAGIRAVLHKPVEPDVLYGILRTHLH